MRRVFALTGVGGDRYRRSIHMKYIRLTCLWGALFFSLSLGLTTVVSFGDSRIFPTFRFYQGGDYASITESTLARIFADRLIGVPKGSDLPRRLASHLYQLCLKNRMDPAFVLSVIHAESTFRVDAVSSAGAVGLMQLMPATARQLGARHASVATLKDPFLNLELGMTYLRQLRERYAGLSAYYPLAAYNLGPYRLDRLRAKPGFRPDKTLRYYEGIMRGVADWRRYGSQVSTMPTKRSALKTKPDGQPKLVDPA